MKENLYDSMAWHHVFASLYLALLASIAMPLFSQTAAAQSDVQSPVRGVVRASSEAMISTDLAAKVSEIGFKEGEGFKAGSILVRFDCRRHEAELASAEAQHREMLVALKGAQHLKKHNAGSRQELETARARAERAQAEADIIRTRVDQCTIRAPFDGRVSRLTIHEHEMSVSGKELLFIVADREPKIELIVPSSWLTWLKPGAAFGFLVDETGKSYASTIVRISAAVDTVSQTIKVFARFDAPATDILPGMSGKAHFQHYGG